MPTRSVGYGSGEPGIQKHRCAESLLRGGDLFLLHLCQHLARFLERAVAGRRAAVDRLLKNYFLDVLGLKAALDEGRAHMRAELLPMAERQERADAEYPPRAAAD